MHETAPEPAGPERFIAEPRPSLDRRGSPRQQVFLTGLVVYGDGQLCACIIVDRSDTGFRVKLLEDIDLPQSFGLIDLLAGVGHDGHVAWKTAPFAGARRLASYDLREPQTGWAATLQSAWKVALA